MTQDGPATGGQSHDDSSEDERASRLAALLSVQIGRPEQAVTDPPVPPAGDEEPAAPEQPSASTGAADEADELAEAPEPAARTDRRRTALSFGVLAVLLLAGLGLVFAGWEIVRDSTEGDVVSEVEDPSAPGYEALVETTPTMVLFHDTGTELDAITVLTLPDPDGEGGGVVLVPRRTVTELPVFGEGPVEVAYDLGDDRVGAEAVGLLLGAAMAERTVVDDERWAELVEPVGPITVDNPNEIEIDGEVVFPIGEIALDPDEVGPYLRALGEDESDLARLFRHELFWEAWLDAVAADGTVGAVPGELDSGIGRFVRTIASGEAVVESLPVEPGPGDRFGEEPTFYLDQDAAPTLLEPLVPFPVSPAPGLRARVRVLNGTSELSEAVTAARSLRSADVEIVLIGNAASSDVTETTVRYFGVEHRDEAEDIADLLGVGEVLEDPRPSDAVDITVTLGADYE